MGKIKNSKEVNNFKGYFLTSMVKTCFLGILSMT